MELETITSAANSKLKLAAALKIRRQREKQKSFTLEGVRLAEMAAASDWGIRFALVTEKAAGEPRVAAILEKLSARRVPCSLVPEPLLKGISSTENPQGILLAMRQKTITLENLPQEDAPCYVVLDGVQDPGNLGTIIRTADAAGLSGVILLKGTTDVYSPKVVRAAMGSLFHLPVVPDIEEADFLTFARSRGLALYGTALDPSATPHFNADYRQPCAILLGNEGNGLSSSLLAATQNIYIPMFGSAESLNVAISAAIVLYEAVRQRHE